MANRPVFEINLAPPHFAEQMVSFVYSSGFSDQQRKKSVESLHNAYLQCKPNAKVLEVSRFSDSVLGQKLSAFNLLTCLDTGEMVPVENAFQSSKVFMYGGPYRDLLYVHPATAKKDERLLHSGPLTGFNYLGEDFPLEPKTFFYDWLYINSLYGDKETTNNLLEYSAFTDIVFNPEKSINCQARTIAIYVSLCITKQINKALRSPSHFKEIVYGDADTFEQLSFF